MHVKDPAQREAIGVDHRRAQVGARAFNGGPRRGMIQTARLHRFRRISPIRAIAQRLLKIGRKRIAGLLLGAKSRLSRLADALGNNGREPLLDEREMLQDVGNRPPIFCGTPVAQMLGDRIDCRA